MNLKTKLIFVILGALVLPLTTFASTGTIDATSKYAWGNNTGFVNFNPTNGNVSVTDSALTGDVWSDTYGWINLNPSHAGVMNNGTGVLSGNAWGQNTGYISFSGVSINSSGVFTGTATGTIIGSLTFDCTNCHVVTTWRAPVVSSGGGGGGGGGGGCCYVAPTPTPSPATTTPTSSLAFPTSASTRLVNDHGTFYLIQNGTRQGVTNPGMLFSYGFEFKDASGATAADLALPQGSLLLPANGALVKSKEDPTVYLISRGQRHGFVSAKVFTALGFKFTSVLVVTNPELQALPKGDNVSNSALAHWDGVNINDHGTIYWINNQTKYPYPSLAVYNSWNIDNNFTRVVTANAADGVLPVGQAVTTRVVQ